MTDYLRILYHLALHSCLLYAGILWFKLGLRKQNTLAIYILLVSFTEISTLLAGQWIKEWSSLIYNVALPLHILAMGFFFHYEWKKKPNLHIHYGISLFTLALVIYQLCTHNVRHFILINGVVLSLFFIYNSLHWLFYQVNNPDAVAITSKMPFWICTGIFSWSIIFIFRLLLKDYLFSIDPSFLDLFQNILSATNVLVYLLFIKGLSCLR
jgi:hypothetical protein